MPGPLDSCSMALTLALAVMPAQLSAQSTEDQDPKSLAVAAMGRFPRGGFVDDSLGYCRTCSVPRAAEALIALYSAQLPVTFLHATVGQEPLLGALGNEGRRQVRDAHEKNSCRPIRPRRSHQLLESSGSRRTPWP